MMKYSIEMDLWGDYYQRVKQDLQRQGITPASDDMSALYQYFNLLKKTITPKPRKVHLSDSFLCPPDLQDAFSLLVSKLENGEDVATHLSRKALDATEFDPLLYDWGVYHLHFGTEIDPNTQFIKRTDELLFLRIDDENAYLIGIYPHSKSWTRQEFVKIIHQNWPESIARNKLKGIVGLDYGNGAGSITDEEYARLRKAGVTTAVEAEKGAVYALLGGGYATSGHSTQITMQSFRIHNGLKWHEEYVRKNISIIAKSIEDQTKKPHGPNYFFKLWHENDTWCIMELVSFAVIYPIKF